MIVLYTTLVQYIGKFKVLFTVPDVEKDIIGVHLQERENRVENNRSTTGSNIVVHPISTVYPVSDRQLSSRA